MGKIETDSREIVCVLIRLVIYDKGKKCLAYIVMPIQVVALSQYFANSGGRLRLKVLGDHRTTGFKIAVAPPKVS